MKVMNLVKMESVNLTVQERAKINLWHIFLNIFPQSDYWTHSTDVLNMIQPICYNVLC